MQKIRHKIEKLKEDMQKKVCKYLCNNYDVILLPKFKVTQIVNKLTRKITSKTARQLLNWNHCGFREMLEKKAGLVGKKVMEVNESYTSKTCTNCGNINEKLKGEKIYKCSKCKIEIDRDVNGARNIFLRALELILPKLNK